MNRSPEPADRSAPARAHARLAAAMLLWGFGTVLALVGNWLHWEWLAVSAPPPYPDQVWGDIAPRTTENALVGAYLVLGVLTLALWMLSAPQRKYNPRPLAKLGTAFRWITILVSGVAVVGILILLAVYLSRWWLLFPGWLGQLFASSLILAGALLLPPFAGEHRALEREKHRGATWAAVAACLVALLAPFPIATLVTKTQVDFHQDQHASAVTAVPVTEEPPWGGAGLAGLTEQDSQAWSRVWRGAKDPVAFPAFGGKTQSVQLLQATLKRNSLILLDVTTGDVLAQMTPAQLDFYGANLSEDPAYDRLVFTFDDYLLRAGNAKEWVSAQGKRYSSGPPTGYVEYQSADLMPTDGVHGLRMTDGTTWFVGDGSGCARRAATSQGSPIITEQGAILMVQVCDENARAVSSWSFPEELTETIEPGTATLFAVDAAGGTLLWERPLPGFAEWAARTGARYPAADYQRLPLAWTFQDGAASVVMDQVETKIDVNSGKETE